MPAQTANFTALLLAGGRSTRMGRDKAAIDVGGVPLWQRQIAKLRELAPAELLISGSVAGPWAGSGIEVVEDAQPGHGPLGGLATILPRMRCERLLVLAVDLPTMTTDFMRGLVMAAPGDGGLVPVIDGRFEPLAAIYPRAMEKIVTRCLEGEDHSLQRMVRLGIEERLIEPRPVSAEELPFFRNLNVPADLDTPQTTQRRDAAAT